MKKFELTTDTKMFFGRKLFRIKALTSFGDVTAGDLGGYVEKEENLSHDNDAWISDNARIFGDARICDNAWISGYAHIYDHADIYGNARIYGNACISGNARICGNACICGNAGIFGDARISGNACIFGNTCSYDNISISDNAHISDDADYLYLKGLGSENRNTTFFKCKDGHIHVSCGCFSGNLSEFENKVKETHGDSKYAKEYLACIEVVKIHFKEENK